MLNEALSELAETWGYTTEEINHIKSKMVEYAMACLYDADQADECEKLSEELPDNIIHVDFNNIS